MNLITGEAPKRRRRQATLAAAILLAAAGGAACSDEDSVFNVAVGDCVEDASALIGSVTELPDVDCTDAHDGEVIFLFEHEGDNDDFPGEEALQSEAGEECSGDVFEDYTGVSFLETSINISLITPSDESWSGGDRETICVASTGETVDESFRNNGDAFPLATDTPGDGSGGDTSLEDFADLVGECEGGDNAACDELYRDTPAGSEAETVGATCGGRSDERLLGTCESELG